MQETWKSLRFPEKLRRVLANSAGGPGAGNPGVAGAGWVGLEPAWREAGEGLPSKADFRFEGGHFEGGLPSEGSALGPVTGFYTLETSHRDLDLS